jgi:hypothetical protein
VALRPSGATRDGGRAGAGAGAGGGSVATAERSATAQSKAAPPSASALLSEAEAERRLGHIEAARDRYRAASALSGLDAEVALLRWARLELAQANAQGAEGALRRYRELFPTPHFAAEARWLEVRALAAAGKREEARRIALEVRERFAGSPQARAASAWLKER